MGIATGVFWIVFGALYVWYKALREEPSVTLVGTALCVMTVVGIVAVWFTYDLILKANVNMGLVFAAIVILAVGGFGLKKLIDQRSKEAYYSALFDEAKQIVNREEYTEEEIAEYTKTWIHTSPFAYMYHPDRPDACKDMIVDSYREKVRYFKVFNELLAEFPYKK